jgi:hypothetical protein
MRRATSVHDYEELVHLVICTRFNDTYGYSYCTSTSYSVLVYSVELNG